MMQRLAVLLLIVLIATVHAIISFIAIVVAYFTNGQPYSRVWYWIARVLLFPLDLTNWRFLDNHEFLGFVINSLLWAIALVVLWKFAWRTLTPRTRGFPVEALTRYSATESD